MGKRVYKPLPPIDVVRDYFYYSIITGKMYYKHQVNNKTKAGDEAGSHTHHSGRVWVSINQERYARARIAWYIITGEDPGTTPVDHINQDKSNDAWHNLRLLTNSNNGVNRRHRVPSTGHRFIYPSDGTYQVLFRRDGMKLRSPRFKLLSEAVEWKQQHITPLLDKEGFLIT